MTDTPDEKPREWWITLREGTFGSEFSSNSADHCGLTTVCRIPTTNAVHVIEKSAYDALKDEYKKYKVHYDRLFESGVLIPTEEYAEQVKERDELRAEVERLHAKYDFQLLVKENARLREALERLTKVGPPSVPTTGSEWAMQCLKDNCEIARAALEGKG